MSVIRSKKLNYRILQQEVARQFSGPIQNLICPDGNEDSIEIEYRVAGFLEIAKKVIEPMAYGDDRNRLETALLGVREKYTETYGRRDYAYRASSAMKLDIEAGILATTGQKPLTVELLVQMVLIGIRGEPKRTPIGAQPWIRTTPRERNV